MTMHDDGRDDQMDDDNCSAQFEADIVAAQEAWFETATREELVAEIKALRKKNDAQTKEQIELMRPAHNLHYGCSAGAERFTAPFACVEPLTKELEQLRREKLMNHRIDLFLSDYRPELMAQVVMTRRDWLKNDVEYGWPKDAVEEFVSNPFLCAYTGWLRPGRTPPDQYRYWAAVVEALPKGGSYALEKVDQLLIDLCEAEEREGYDAGKAGLDNCPYPYHTFKACMWRQGERSGQYDRRKEPRLAQLAAVS